LVYHIPYARLTKTPSGHALPSHRQPLANFPELPARADVAVTRLREPFLFQAHRSVPCRTAH
jgi:hypothetical protein